MKIGQKPELPAALAQTGQAKPAKSPAAAPVEGAAKDAVAASAAGVPVTVSSSVRGLDQGARAAGDFDAGKVKAVRSAIENGTFSVNADAIADKMLSNAQEILARARG
ncbi:flagellar biosynthesis anti-sigma factor FlgM [Paracidovorax sp. MALMAid1276]|uniref:flagellar biosynthesis anti-sigma factor FlgM n=1 Tax=Paracidovorax sp. MALMAid1276 TaxID=3411631 RepID=UPI003B9A1C3A